MATWEYKVIEQTRRREGKSLGLLKGKAVTWQPDVPLKELGGDGWELVSVVPLTYEHESEHYGSGTHRLQYFFKRRID